MAMTPSAHRAVFLGLVAAVMLASGCVPLPPATQPLDGGDWYARAGANSPGRDAESVLRFDPG